MKLFINEFFHFFKANRISIGISLAIVFILNLNKTNWYDAANSQDDYHLEFYAIRLLIYLCILFFILLTIFLTKKGQIQAVDIIFVILNSAFQFGFNIYLILTLPSRVTRGYDMGIVSIPLYSLLGTALATIVFVISYILISISTQKKVIKISFSFILSALTTFIVMKYFICNDDFYI